MLAIPSLRSLQILSPRPSEGAKVTLLHFFAKKFRLIPCSFAFRKKSRKLNFLRCARYRSHFYGIAFFIRTMGVFLLYGRFFLFRKKQAFCEVLTSFAKIRINLNSLLLNKIRKILILRKAREAVERRKNKRSLF